MSSEGTLPAPASPLTVSEVARAFKVSAMAVRRWADAGKLASFRTPGGQRRFRPEDVQAFLDGGASEQPEAAAS